MESSGTKSKYGKLLQQTGFKPTAPAKAPQDELDSLIDRMEQLQKVHPDAGGGPTDAGVLEQLRGLILQDLIPAFLELSQKYAPRGIVLRMDASSFLQGGRGWDFEFRFGDHRCCLHGTVTSEKVAFEETRYAPHVDGELASGPVLRIRHLNVATLRDFVCERLTLLLKSAMRKT
jgi:hypothetical protein